MGDSIVYENDKYIVKVGNSIHNEGGITCYQIINRQYDVIEAETTMLPSAIRTADDLEDSLAEIEEDDEHSVEDEKVTLQ